MLTRLQPLHERSGTDRRPANEVYISHGDGRAELQTMKKRCKMRVQDGGCG